MKTRICSILAAGIMFLLVNQASAVTFPVAKDATVSADGSGNITVRATGESGWVLVQFCQDNLRAGCGNNQLIEASSDSGGTMVFRMDPGGVSSGQVAFNFRNKKLDKRPWLHIPDCQVKLAGNLEMGMSYYTADIPESGGAHFVYTGSGQHAWSPIDMSACNQQRISVIAKRAVSVSAPATGGGQNQTVVKSPHSQNAQTKQIAHISGNGGKNKIVQQSATVSQRGATVTVHGNVTAKECPAGKDCVPGIDARTTNITQLSFGESRGSKTVESDCVGIVNARVVSNCEEREAALAAPVLKVKPAAN